METYMNSLVGHRRYSKHRNVAIGVKNGCEVVSAGNLFCDIGSTIVAFREVQVLRGQLWDMWRTIRGYARARDRGPPNRDAPAWNLRPIARVGVYDCHRVCRTAGNLADRPLS